jgi:spore germination protein KC
MHKLITVLATPESSLILPEIKVSGKTEVQNNMDAFKETRIPAVIKLGGTGVFKKDKFKGWLTNKESLGVAWITNSMKSTTVVFPCEGEDRNDQLSSFEVEKAHTKLKPILEDGNLTMNVEIELRERVFYL